MAQTALFQTEDIGKIIRKLDPEAMLKPVQEHALDDLSAEGAGFLRGKLSSRYPVTSASVGVKASKYARSIEANRHPYVFAERGSQYPVARQLQPGAPLSRSHRRRRGVSNSALRQKPLRYLSQTRREIRRKTPAALDKAAKGIEKAWAV